MTREQYRAVPAELTGTRLQLHHLVLVAMMLDARKTSKQHLSQLYAKGRSVELDLRNIKTTTGMDVLRCQTAHTNRKEIWGHLLAYNVIRLLMAQAASHYATDPRTLSFKHTLQLWTEWLARGLASTHEQSILFNLSAQSCIGIRASVSSHECENEDQGLIQG